MVPTINKEGMMKWDWKAFFCKIFERIRNEINFRHAVYMGLGVLAITGFIFGIFFWAYEPIDQVGQKISEGFLALFGHSIDIAPPFGFVAIVILSVLFGRILIIKRARTRIDWFLFKIPLIGWLWRITRNFQTGLEGLKYYKVVEIYTYPGVKELFLVKKIVPEFIECLDGTSKFAGYRAMGFLPSYNNPSSGRGFTSVDVKVIANRILNPIEEIFTFIITCTLATPKLGWLRKEIDWQEFDIKNINKEP